MQQDVLPSTKRIIDSAEFVQINPKNLDEFCRSLGGRSLESYSTSDVESY
jgi:hypothetical protein